MDDEYELLEYELLEDDLALEGLAAEFCETLRPDRLTPFSELEKAASSILFLVLEGLIDPGEGLFELSEFNLEDDAWEGLEDPFLLRLAV